MTRRAAVVAAAFGSGAAVAASAAAIGSSLRSRDRAARRRFELELDAAVAAVHERLRLAEARARRHDLANAMTAVEGAATILAREQLRPTDRSTLTEVLESGLSRVHRLLRSDAAPGGAADVVLAEVVAAATKEQGGGERIELDLHGDVIGRGSPGATEEALRQLLAYARGRAPGCALTVRSDGDGAGAVVWVEDRGLPIAARQRRSLVDPDRRRWRLAVTPLDVAVRLARGQGGEVRIEERVGGGASFGLCLPVSDG